MSNSESGLQYDELGFLIGLKQTGRDVAKIDKNVEQIRDMIGADYLGYLSEEGVYKSCEGKEGFCMGCFNGVYPVAAPVENQVQ